MKSKPGKTHQQAVGKKGPEGAGFGSIPNPPGSRDIPGEHGNVDPTKEMLPLDTLPLQPQQREESDKDQEGERRHRPGSKKQKTGKHRQQKGMELFQAGSFLLPRVGGNGLPAIIRGLLRDLYIMRMAFLHPGVGNSDKLGLLL